jgi:hypothetical protein
MDSTAAVRPDSDSLHPARRRRDRLRALITAPSRFPAVSSIFRRRSVSTQSAGQISSRPPVTEPEAVDMVSRLAALDPFFADDNPELQNTATTEESFPSPQASAGTRLSRRMSMTLHGLLNPQNRASRNRIGMRFPN